MVPIDRSGRVFNVHGDGPDADQVPVIVYCLGRIQSKQAARRLNVYPAAYRIWIEVRVRTSWGTC